MAAAIERYLKDFGRPDDGLMAVGIVPISETPNHTLPALPADPDPPVVDVEAVQAVAFERGREAATGELSIAHQAEMEEERSRHLAEVNELFVRLEQEFATTLATRLDEMASQLVETIGSQVAGVLAPVVESAVRDRMVADLGVLIAQTLSDRDGVKVAVSGSPTMHEALISAMGARAEQLDFTVDDALDLTVRLDDTVLSTRLAEWAAAVREMMA